MAHSIPQQLVDSILVKSGRRCCVCRRFRPTKLQVHHILERSKGGADAEDNLMPICLMCHSDVHSSVPFARRFTVEELKGHRDSLFRVVANGTLPSDEPDNSKEVTSAVVKKLAATSSDEPELSPAAVQLLLHAAHGKKHREGRVYIMSSMHGTEIKAGDSGPLCDATNSRAVAEYSAALEELVGHGLSEPQSDSVHLLTHAGYLKADELETLHGKTTE